MSIDDLSFSIDLLLIACGLKLAVIVDATYFTPQIERLVDAAALTAYHSPMKNNVIFSPEREKVVKKLLISLSHEREIIFNLHPVLAISPGIFGGMSVYEIIFVTGAFELAKCVVPLEMYTGREDKMLRDRLARLRTSLCNGTKVDVMHRLRKGSSIRKFAEGLPIPC